MAGRLGTFCPGAFRALCGPRPSPKPVVARAVPVAEGDGEGWPVVYCTICAYFSCNRLLRLADRCPAHVGGRKAVLRRLLKGLHSDRKARANLVGARPWLRCAVSASAWSQAGGEHTKPTSLCQAMRGLAGHTGWHADPPRVDGVAGQPIRRGWSL